MTYNPRALFAVAAVAAVLFVVALISQHPEHRERVTAVLSDTVEKARPFSGKNTYDIAQEKEADTVADSDDNYYFPTRNGRVKMLNTESVPFIPRRRNISGLEYYGDNFYITVDDGGHAMVQQIRVSSTSGRIWNLLRDDPLSQNRRRRACDAGQQ
ncbi:hypothetical protein Daus18300_013864 [Diaporthe australafricana]|uniref:Uncharacterized protein n=1 Tax=Diaporthe australafricana TaxID=127596 RepID=A0ABR3VXH6_9PEZI